MNIKKLPFVAMLSIPAAMITLLKLYRELKAERRMQYG